MSSVGETLRRERLKRNLELDQISRELKISRRFLESIEEERFEGLPAGVFTRSFVRQYADLLGLDGETIAAEVQRSIAPEPAEAAPVFPQSDIHLPRLDTWESIGDRHGVNSTLPALALVVVVMLVCSGVYAFWQRTHHDIQSPPQTAAIQQPSAPAPSAATPAPPPGPAAGQPAPVPGAPTAVPPTPSPSGASTSAIEAAQPAGEGPTQRSATNSADRPAPESHPVVKPATAANPPAGAADASVPPTAGVHLQLNAEEPVWVLARANGKYLFSGTLSAHETHSIDADGTVLVRLGNAGGVSITYNGKAVGSLGPKGQVRDIQFTSGGFHILAAPKPPAPPAGGTPAAPPPEPR